MVGGTGHRCDVGDRDAVHALADEVGPVQILINNAGIWRFGPVLEASESDLNDVLRVNLLGTVHCRQAFSSAMAEGKGGGAIRQPLLGRGGDARRPVWASSPASKGAIELLTQQLAVESGPTVDPALPRRWGQA